MHVKPKPITSLSSFLLPLSSLSSTRTCTQAFVHVDQNDQEALLTHLHTFILFTFISGQHVSLFAICSAQFTRNLTIIFIFGKPPSTWKINSIPCLGILNSYLKSKSVQHNCHTCIKLQKIQGTLKCTSCCTYIHGKTETNKILNEHLCQNNLPCLKTNQGQAHCYHALSLSWSVVQDMYHTLL